MITFISLLAAGFLAVNPGMSLGSGVNLSGAETSGAKVARPSVNLSLAQNETDDEDNDEDDKEKKDREIKNDLPRGILRAPGVELRLLMGKGLPPGIANKVKADVKVDVTAPLIEEIRVRAVTTDGARVRWETNERATGRVLISALTPIVESRAKVYVAEELKKEQTVSVTGLTPDTKYFALVQSTDANGNASASQEFSFRTKPAPRPEPEPDKIAPEFIGIRALEVESGSALILWMTNERTDSRVWLSQTSPVATTDATAKSSANLSFFHVLRLTNLVASTTYYLKVGSADRSGNLALSSEASFTTAAR